MSTSDSDEYDEGRSLPDFELPRGYAEVRDALHRPRLRCAMCHNLRPDIDMALINDDAYCHLSWQVKLGTTCYQRAQDGPREMHDLFPGSGAVSRAWETYNPGPTVADGYAESKREPDLSGGADAVA